MSEPSGTVATLTVSTEATDAFGMTEKNYRELLDLIAGRGKWWIFGGAGFHTWPDGDPEQERTHAVLCEMERRGMVERVIDEPGHACFKAILDAVRASTRHNRSADEMSLTLRHIKTGEVRYSYEIREQGKAFLAVRTKHPVGDEVFLPQENWHARNTLKEAADELQRMSQRDEFDVDVE